MLVIHCHHLSWGERAPFSVSCDLIYSRVCGRLAVGRRRPFFPTSDGLLTGQRKEEKTEYELIHSLLLQH